MAAEEKIGSSSHPWIGPSADHGIGFRWPDDPMAFWISSLDGGEKNYLAL
jgi:hypothetical protein